MKHLRFLTIIVILLSFSCQKKVSVENDFIGLWKEKGSTNGATIEFKINNTAYFNDTHNPIRKFYYKFDEKLGYIYFSVYDNPESGGHNKYLYDILSKELTIWDLYISIPENPSIIIFTKNLF